MIMVLVKMIFSIICLVAFAVTCIVMGLFLPVLAIIDGIQAVVGEGPVS